MLGSQTQLPWITGAVQLRLHAGADRLKFAHESAAATEGTASAATANRTRSPLRIDSPLVSTRFDSRFDARSADRQYRDTVGGSSSLQLWRGFEARRAARIR